MNDQPDAPRLYLVTPPRFDLPRLSAQIQDAVAEGAVACVRIEAPGATEADLRAAVDALLPICRNADVALVIAEHFRLVKPLGLDGVHVEAGVNLRDVRATIGKDQIVGVHCGVSRHTGMTAAEAGADYIAFGPVADTGGLGDGALAPLDLFQWWSEMIETPVVAEGGLDPSLAATLAPYVDFITPYAEIWNEDRPSVVLKEFLLK